MIFDRMLEIMIMIMQRELFSIAPKVCAQIANATVWKHISKEPIAQAIIKELPHDNDLVQSFDPSKRSKRYLAHMPETLSPCCTQSPQSMEEAIPKMKEKYL